MRARIDRARKRSLHDGSDDAQDQFKLSHVGSVQKASDGCNDLACLHDGSPLLLFCTHAGSQKGCTPIWGKFQE